MTEIFFTVIGDESASLMVRNTGRRAANLEPVLEAIGEEMLASERRLFETSGASAFGRWAPLKASTLKRKRGYPFPTRVLTRTGNEALSFSSRSHPDNIFDVRAHSVEIGSMHPAVGFQRWGTRHMHRREPLRFRQRQKDHWRQMISDFIMNGTL